jgi:hypothetical protein
VTVSAQTDLPIVLSAHTIYSFVEHALDKYLETGDARRAKNFMTALFCGHLTRAEVNFCWATLFGGLDSLLLYDAAVRRYQQRIGEQPLDAPPVVLSTYGRELIQQAAAADDMTETLPAGLVHPVCTLLIDSAREELLTVHPAVAEEAMAGVLRAQGVTCGRMVRELAAMARTVLLLGWASYSKFMVLARRAGKKAGQTDGKLRTKLSVRTTVTLEECALDVY